MKRVFAAAGYACLFGVLVATLGVLAIVASPAAALFIFVEALDQ